MTVPGNPTTNDRSDALPEDAVRTEIEVATTPIHAFEVFTTGIDRWWLRSHHVLPGELAEVGVEPQIGGRLWERNGTGDVCTFGRVLRCEPGAVFAFSWLLDANWAVPTEDAEGSRVTVTFSPVPAGTRVTLVHDRLAVHGPDWPTIRGAVDSAGGWQALLGGFATAAS